MHEAVLRLGCASATDAAALARALAVDDATQASVEGADVQVTLMAGAPLGLLRAIEDVLECARATGLLRDERAG